MRTFKEVKDEQDHAIFQLGVHIASAEQWKRKVLELVTEADQVLALTELAKAQEAAELGEENGQSKDSGGETAQASEQAEKPGEALTQ